jgi:predicted transglutaminase-like protease
VISSFLEFVNMKIWNVVINVHVVCSYRNVRALCSYRNVHVVCSYHDAVCVLNQVTARI